MAIQRRLGILSQRLGPDSGDCALDNSSSLATATGTTSTKRRDASDELTLCAAAA
jgi:hypothetical protein